MGALERKPCAFARWLLHNKVFPRAVYRQSWEQLVAQKPEREACRAMVGLLVLAADVYEAQLAQQLEQLIAAADTVVFVVSPDSIASEVVAWELSVVEKLNKRLAPIIWRTVANDKVPTAISKLHYIHFTEPGAFEKSLDTLVTAIDTDIGWLGEHTRLGALARRWDADGRSRSEVLRGAPLDAGLSRYLLHPFYGVDGFQIVCVFLRIQALAAAARSR